MAFNNIITYVHQFMIFMTINKVNKTWGLGLVGIGETPQCRWAISHCRLLLGWHQARTMGRRSSRRRPRIRRDMAPGPAQGDVNQCHLQTTANFPGYTGWCMLTAVLWNANIAGLLGRQLDIRVGRQAGQSWARYRPFPRNTELCNSLRNRPC